MAALDTFEWWIAGISPDRRPAMEKFIHDQREYLLMLRSEDERQRFVAEIIEQTGRAQELSSK